MESIKDVTLHVWELQPSEEQRQQQQQQNAGMGAFSFIARILPSMGMGAYHTCLEVNNERYTFQANRGIVKSRSRVEAVPGGANYKEAIDLGACSVNTGELNNIITKLRKFFHETSYHLVHRNCNHFSETFATAIILRDELPNPKCPNLKTFPPWINRLANTSQAVVGHDDDIVPCDVMNEARKATGADEKVDWELSSSKKETGNKPSRTQKKELTEKQKAALAKIRGNKK